MKVSLDSWKVEGQFVHLVKALLVHVDELVARLSPDPMSVAVLVVAAGCWCRGLTCD